MDYRWILNLPLKYSFTTRARFSIAIDGKIQSLHTPESPVCNWKSILLSNVSFGWRRYYALNTLTAFSTKEKIGIVMIMKLQPAHLPYQIPFRKTASEVQQWVVHFRKVPVCAQREIAGWRGLCRWRHEEPPEKRAKHSKSKFNFAMVVDKMLAKVNYVERRTDCCSYRSSVFRWGRTKAHLSVIWRFFPLEAKQVCIPDYLGDEIVSNLTVITRHCVNLEKRGIQTALHR